MERFHAHHPVLGRDLEVRLAIPVKGQTPALFTEERSLLLEMDHPVLAPVLASGTMAGREYYTVPFRPREDRLFPLEGSSLELWERQEALLGVASLLASLEAVGVHLRALHPAWIFWDQARGSPCIPFPLALQTQARFGGLPGVPEAILKKTSTAARLDLLCWGILAYRVLGGFGPVFSAEEGPPRPLLQREPSLPEPLALAIDACLSPGSGGAPEDAEELLEGLGEGGGEEPLEEEYVEPTSAPVAKSVVATQPVAMPVSKRFPWEVVGVFLACFLLVLGGKVWMGERKAPEASLPAKKAMLPPVATNPTKPPKNKATLSSEAIADLKEELDAEFRALLARPPVTEESFDEVIHILKQLSQRGALPEKMEDPKRFQRILSLARSEKKVAAGLLNFYISRGRP
jgi:hypothetical protein